MTLVTSAAVEATVPDVVRANELGLAHLTRPQFLAKLLNAAQRSVAVGGTSGKSTVTGMIGWILHACHRQPTVMNGAVMKNFVTPSAPFASALVGDPELFVSEVDESDGSIALYKPEIAVLTNISLDHKEMDELRSLFAAFLLRAAQGGGEPRRSRDPRASPTSSRPTSASATASTAPAPISWARTCSCSADGVDVRGRSRGRAATTSGSRVPGRHNASNALAAIAAARALGVRIEDAVSGARAASKGCERRLETVGDGGRRHRDRRFRPQPGQDRRDAGDACARSPGGC